MTKRLLIWGLFMLVAALLMPAVAVRADEGPSRIDLSAQRLRAGATLEVRGNHLVSDAIQPVWLVKGNVSLVLGEATTDAHGDFLGFFVVPTEAVGGNYAVISYDADRRPVSAPIVIEDAAGAVDSEGLRDRSEPMLLPVPQAPAAMNAQQANPMPAQQVQAPVSPAPAPRIGVPILLAGLLLLVLCGGLLAARRSAFRRS